MILFHVLVPKSPGLARIISLHSHANRPRIHYPYARHRQAMLSKRIMSYRVNIGCLPPPLLILPHTQESTMYSDRPTSIPRRIPRVLQSVLADFAS